MCSLLELLAISMCVRRRERERECVRVCVCECGLVRDVFVF